MLVFGEIGREVRILVDGRQTAGGHSVEFSADKHVERRLFLFNYCRFISPGKENGFGEVSLKQTARLAENDKNSF